MAKKVLVLIGGFSAEREVSLSSGKDIAAALQTKGYETLLYDLQNAWDFVEVLKKEKPDVFFAWVIIGKGSIIFWPVFDLVLDNLIFFV